jgi:hypothetical protein
VLRVTEAIAACGLVDTTWMTDLGRDRGSAVHLATALDDAGDLDETSVHEMVAPYLESWRRFRRETGIKIVATELEVRHDAMRYVGHLDRIVRWPARPEALCVLDLKTGAPARWHAIQTALYALAYASKQGSPTPERGAVYLHDDGRAATYRPHRSRRDYDVAKSVVTLAHWIRQEQS